jgi:phenylpyruvate tautomerase PptA (4-oxalocrotonate tautomerase family)
MPLVRIDAIEGRSEAEVESLLNAAHRAVVSAFGVPEGDRYQIYSSHPKSNVVVLDTGLGIARTDKLLVFTIFSKRRDEALKRKLYVELTQQLQAAVSIAPSDVVICVIENAAPDWSFGNGEPQFLTGKLK